MENSNTFKSKFIEKCNTIADGKTFYEEDILPDNIKHTTWCFILDIFNQYENGNDKALERETFEAITQENMLKIIEKGILEIFKEDVDTYNSYDYMFNGILRSGLQFLIDYAENNEDTKCVIKKRLQTILNHKNTIYATKRLYKFKKRLWSLKYLNKYNFNLDLTHIPLSHDWWKRKK